ncbi:hypothetical protein J27TS7_38960 [Paenibacillus dendritiformis]|uniref:DUF7601 domain-containing protein n=1 Tax=Paenibacillus dendritiformis TaxID=130049 RepID=UPI001B07EDDC|nr:Ig-like domain-containing protein [Paenibacillus dendritiformis]GIO74382.1 hypothetical protein J27TS7_38960 [Paenibacillus dendritiformis]
MKRKRSISNSMLSFCLAVLLILQSVTFSAPVYAESAPVDSGTETVIETGSPTATEPSVTEAVYDAPASFAAIAIASPSDKTAVFMGANSTFPLEVKQGTPLAVIEPGGTIQGRQPFTLMSEGLKVPVNGDDDDPTNANPALYIQKGDWIELRRDDYFKEVVLPTATKTLMATTEVGVKPLGTAYFTPNSIKIVFNGDDGFFNGVGTGVTFGFETTANSDVAGLDYGKSRPISIFGGAYQLKNPDVTPDYSITLSSPGMIKWDQYGYRGIQPAQFVEGAVTWQSTASAFDKFDKALKLSLDGTKFFTDPASYNTGFGNVRGIYVHGSFKVNDIAVEPDIDADGKLSYIFPAGTGADPKVEFKTWIPKEAYYYEYKNPPGNLGRSYRDMNGKVQLKQSDDTVSASAGQEISFAPDWIQASGVYDHANETITWTADVNRYNKKGLKNLAITDVLPAGLEFVSATYQKWEDGVASEVRPITPDENSVYFFGDVNGKVQLVIKSKVKSGSSFTNIPRANWDLDTKDANGNFIQNNDVTTGTRPNAVTDEAIITVGAHTFTKAGSISMEDFNLGGITWTVNLTPQYALPNGVVYDVLVHGGDLNVLNDAVDETGEVSAETIAKIKENVTTAQLWKKYHKDTLKSANGLTLKAIPLTVNGKVVADLIKATGYTTDQAASFSFRALETNTDVLFRQDINAEKTRWNRALLFDGETVKQTQNSINLHLRMLNKDMLTASYPMKKDGTADTWYTPNDVNRYIGYDGSSSGDEYTLAGYDRTTKTVTFRLGVNMPGYNTVEMAKEGGNRVISDIKLVDTLPEGWEFVPFSEGKDFELYKGYSDNGGGTGYGVRNNAVSIIKPNDPAHVVSFSHSGNVGTFTFSKLESPYVILVKARPSNAALEKYLEEYTTNGTDRQVLYNKADLHMTWGGVEKVVTEQRKVIVPIQALGKSVTKPVPGVLEWTVNYTPPFNMDQGVYLQDTLGAGMNLRYDEFGKLVLIAPSMAVYRAKLTASGALERDGAALNLSDPNCEVQVEAEPGAGGTTVLKFKMKDPNKFYQFVYQTEVDPSKAKAGDKMGNEVKLTGDDKLNSISAKSESTLDSSDVAGSSSTNALLPLKKVDPDGNPLQGVEFTLYKKDGGAQAASGKTGKDGKLNLLFPNPGYYELKETYIDTTTWLPTTRIYQVYVGNTPGKPIWVDGVKVTSDNPLIVPTPIAGKLTISNTVAGNGGDQNKEFVFTITFEGEGKGDSYPYIKPDGTSGMIKNGDNIQLKHGQTAVIPKLPKDLVYTVTENDYSAVGYSTDPAKGIHTGTIVGNGDHKAPFVNTRMVYGRLLIGNTVTGNGGDKHKEFTYKVNFTGSYGAGDEYTYTKSNGGTGTIISGGTITLKHGETVTVDNLPEGLTYTVEQTAYTSEDYETTPAELTLTGSIVQATTAEANFVNHRDLPGGLLIRNTVTGNGGDVNKEFEYTVTFTGAGADRTYTYTKPDGTTGTIRSGDKLLLKHGQTVTIAGILKDTLYIVTEADYTSDGYTTDPESREYTGNIKEDEIAQVPFVNARYLPGTLALEPKTAKVPGDGKTPSELTATLTGTDGNPVEGKKIVFKLEDGTVIGTAVTDEDGKAKIHYTPPKLSDTTPKEHEITATTTATSPSGVPYNEDKAIVIAMPAALTGVLRDNNTGLVIPNAVIIVKNVKTGEEQTITTDSEGKYYHPVQRDEEYTISYSKMVDIDGISTPVPFTQKAYIEGTNPTTEGNLIPAEITAVGIVLFKQPDGKTSLLNNALAGKLHVYLKDENGSYISENGVPKAFPLQNNGTFSAAGLSTGKYTMEVRYEFEPGKELTLIRDAKLDVKANGELNISQELVDPYGIITDATTGATIEGAEVTLYYADTPRNIANGIVPGTKVTLPVIPGFAPNDNASPSQKSDATGAYAYMVFPDTDYYLVVTKSGYVTYTSPTISVGSDIVRYDVQLTPTNGSGSGNAGTGNGNAGTGNGNTGTGNGNAGTGNGNAGTGNGNTGTGNGNAGTGNGNTGTGNGNTGTGNGNTGTGNGNTGAGSGNTGTGSGNTGAGNGNTGTGNGNTGASNGNTGTGNGNGNTGTGNGNTGAGHRNNGLDNVPTTGDNSPSPIFYMALALMSLMAIGFCLLSGKKKKNIQ